MHALPGGANLAVWSAFTTFGLVPMGIATTVAHGFFVAAHALCAAGGRNAGSGARS